MSFIVYDLSLLVICIIALALFVHRNRSNFSIEGWMYIYKTKWGIISIDKTSKKYSRILQPLQYLVLIIGYMLMVSMTALLAYSAYIYVRYPLVSQIVSAPPIFPVFPYFTRFFGLSAFFPDFPFISFILAISVVAVSHEYAHGIFARLNKIRIHSTGFAFLRLFKMPLPILGAFVEQDDKDMEKASKLGQLAVLGAGVFANIVMTLLFLGVIWIFFLAAFQPAGLQFATYAQSELPLVNITSVNGVPITSFSGFSVPAPNYEEFLTLEMNGRTYYANPDVLQYSLTNNLNVVRTFEDTPAFKNKLPHILLSIDGESITNLASLTASLSSKQPGQAISVKALENVGDAAKTYSLTLAERDGKAFLGIGGFASGESRKGIIAFVMSLMPKIKNNFTGVYSSSRLGEFGVLIFYLFWWVVILNFLVALFNMLPLGPLDGGRFLLISVWGLTGNRKAGERAFKWASSAIMLIFIIIILAWIFARYWPMIKNLILP